MLASSLPTADTSNRPSWASGSCELSQPSRSLAGPPPSPPTPAYRGAQSRAASHSRERQHLQRLGTQSLRLGAPIRAAHNTE